MRPSAPEPSPRGALWPNFYPFGSQNSARTPRRFCAFGRRCAPSDAERTGMTTPSRPRRVPNLALGRNSEQKKSDFPIWPAALESPGELWSPPVADMLPAIFLDPEGFRSRPIALWIAHEPLPKVHASAAALRRYLWVFNGHISGGREGGCGRRSGLDSAAETSAVEAGTCRHAATVSTAPTCQVAWVKSTI